MSGDVTLSGEVVAVARSAAHEFSKPTAQTIRLLTGLGVEGDAHLGTTVQHRSRVAADPTQPNLRQVHLIQAELLDELRAVRHLVAPGDLGENVTTRGIDLLGLPVGALLRVGPDAVVEVTGLRNPCRQIDDFQPGLLRRVVGRDSAGEVVRKSGVMGVVLSTGNVRAGDPIGVELPSRPHRRLERV